MNRDDLIREFRRLEEAHRNPLLIFADGKALHDPTLVQTGLYRNAH